MRLTTKGRFAVTAMIDVAMHGTKAPVTLAGVSQRQKISLSYLEQLFGKLRRHGLVDSVRGPAAAIAWHAGPKRFPWRTSSSPSTSLSTPRSAAGRENCKDDGKRCMTHELWANLNAHIFELSCGRSRWPSSCRSRQKPDVTVLQDQRAQAATPRTPATADAA